MFSIFAEPLRIVKLSDMKLVDYSSLLAILALPVKNTAVKLKCFENNQIYGIIDAIEPTLIVHIKPTHSS